MEGLHWLIKDISTEDYPAPDVDETTTPLPSALQRGMRMGPYYILREEKNHNVDTRLVRLICSEALQAVPSN